MHSDFLLLQSLILILQTTMAPKIVPVINLMLNHPIDLDHTPLEGQDYKTLKHNANLTCLSCATGSETISLINPRKYISRNPDSLYPSPIIFLNFS